MNLSGSEAALQHHHYILSQDMEGKHIPESHVALRFDWPAICGVRQNFILFCILFPDQKVLGNPTQNLDNICQIFQFFFGIDWLVLGTSWE